MPLKRYRIHLRRGGTFEVQAHNVDEAWQKARSKVRTMPAAINDKLKHGKPKPPASYISGIEEDV